MLPKGLQNQLAKALADVDDKRHRAALALDACAEEEVKPYVPPHNVVTLRVLDKDMEKYRDAMALSMGNDETEPNRENAKKSMTDSTQTRRDHLCCLTKIEGTCNNTVSGLCADQCCVRDGHSRFKAQRRNASVKP